ncbi:MAG TPA: potassium transporter TrkG [Bacilli bacterium]|nr:potassium transporter TrkG [Bacilli bacterium]MDD3388948.1 potassium transporter TrkG [Bacilli bacterium]MDD4344387.1 potassium transporter TrkG [Bacilli bacterium]MDD4520709.1 potassium transporter TrkG [Bacilli bacterium]MDY0399316.1 potassium transporter TrkG [Bacilli bacterium]
MYNLFKKLHISPYLAVLLSFMLVIFIGSFLLWVPWAHQSGSSGSYLDNLFTAASAVCVTGLTVFPDINAEFTLYGKIILGLLIQIGGLGFIAIFTFFITLFGKKLNVLDRYLVKEALSISQYSGVVSLVRSMIIISLIVETIGVIPFMLVFVPEFGWIDGIGKSIFHSISSFNNAGFDLLGSSSLSAYKSNYIVIINTMLLVITGGLGFVCISDIARNRKARNWQMLTKVSLTMAAILIVGGAIGLFFTNLGTDITILDALFQSVIARTAGFSTVDVAGFSTAGRFIFIVLMFIGAGSLSTGGGVKTSTIYVIAKTIISYIRGKQAHGFKRKLHQKLFLQAVTLVIIAVSLIAVGILIIDGFENVNAANVVYHQERYGLESVVFEAFSAFATVGNSFGITPYLTDGSKIVIVTLMYAGRVGPMTVMSVVSDAMNREEKLHFQYIEAELIVG